MHKYILQDDYGISDYDLWEKKGMGGKLNLATIRGRVNFAERLTFDTKIRTVNVWAVYTSLNMRMFFKSWQSSPKMSYRYRIGYTQTIFVSEI